MHLLRSGLFLGMLICLSLMAWDEGEAQPTVYVVNYPLQYFVERIGGEQIEVVFPAPADKDPASWRPDLVVMQQNVDRLLKAFQ